MAVTFEVTVRSSAAKLLPASPSAGAVTENGNALSMNAPWLGRSQTGVLPGPKQKENRLLKEYAVGGGLLTSASNDFRAADTPSCLIKGMGAAVLLPSAAEWAGRLVAESGGGPLDGTINAQCTRDSAGLASPLSPLHHSRAGAPSRDGPAAGAAGAAAVIQSSFLIVRSL